MAYAGTLKIDDKVWYDDAPGYVVGLAESGRVNGRRDVEVFWTLTDLTTWVWESDLMTDADRAELLNS